MIGVSGEILVETLVEMWVAATVVRCTGCRCIAEDGASVVEHSVLQTLVVESLDQFRLGRIDRVNDCLHHVRAGSCRCVNVSGAIGDRHPHKLGSGHPHIVGRRGLERTRQHFRKLEPDCIEGRASSGCVVASRNVPQNEIENGIDIRQGTS